MTVDIQAAKERLRAEILAGRQRLTAGDLMVAGEAIATLAEQRWQAARTVAAYLAVGTEPPTLPLLDALSGRGTDVLLPVIVGADLDWARYAGPQSLAPGPLGINEPTGSRLGADAVQTASVVLVPALAADRQGNRLGRGRGYYDRALASITAPIVAIVFDTELVDAVPVEPHDRAVDAVLRPAGLTRCRA